MSLTKDDISEIRIVVEDIFDRKLEPILGRLEALENDVKEIYRMISEMQKNSINDEGFRKLSAEKRLLTINTELLAAAKELGIKLPR